MKTEFEKAIELLTAVVNSSDLIGVKEDIRAFLNRYNELPQVRNERLANDLCTFFKDAGGGMTTTRSLCIAQLREGAADRSDFATINDGIRLWGRLYRPARTVMEYQLQQRANELSTRMAAIPRKEGGIDV